MLSSHLCLGLPSGLLPSGLPTKMLYAPLTSPMRATCPAAHLILLALITLTILGEEYKPCSSSLCSLKRKYTQGGRSVDMKIGSLGASEAKRLIYVKWANCDVGIQ
jgi:hypothetical protein